MTVLPFQPIKPNDSKPVPPPLFNLPPLTLWTLVSFIAIMAVMSFGPGDVMAPIGYMLAFVPARFTDAEYWTPVALVTPVTHLFLHGGWLHVAMNGLMLMAFGSAAEKTLGAKRAALLFLGSGLCGALAQFAFEPHTLVPMVGASGALSGLFAAVILRLQKAGQMPVGRYGIWGVAALWIGLSLLTAGVGSAIGLGNVAWAAHAGGFIGGILLAQRKYFSA